MNEGTFLPVIISRLRKKITNLFARELQPFGITPEQWALLVYLDRKPSCSQMELAQALFKDRSNITRILDKLAKQGLINRQDHPEDRRIYLVNLTKAGQELLPNLRRVADKTQHLLTENLPEKELASILDILAKIEKQLD